MGLKCPPPCSQVVLAVGWVASWIIQPPSSSKYLAIVRGDKQLLMELQGYLMGIIKLPASLASFYY